jgi:hypothetical protein
MVLSIVHFLIPNHWLPLVSISQSERWSLSETLNITVLTALAHTLSTISLGIVIGIIGLRLSDRYSAFTDVAAPLILVGMGFIYFGMDLRSSQHEHFPNQTSLGRKSKIAIIASLCIAMFFSPCFEIETYFLAAGSFGWQGIGIISIVYLLVTITGITIMVWAGYRGAQRFQWHWLECHEKKVTGSILILLGIVSFLLNN